MNRLPSTWPDSVTKVLAMLIQAGYEAYLVGGCVRDLLRGEPVHDYDVTTNARPESVVQLFPHTLPTGIVHGTVTVIMDAFQVEVTTFRRESGYSDGRHPDVVDFHATLEQDLARRDFTINAMAIDVQGHLYDPYGGQQDLTTQVVRAVGDPTERFAEDGLRILRAIRFAAVLQFRIEPATYRAMITQAARIDSVARERIGQEFRRIAMGAWWTVAQDLGHGPWLQRLAEPWRQLQNGFRRLPASPRWESLQERLGSWNPWQIQGTMAALWCYAAELSDAHVHNWLLGMAWERGQRNLVEDSVRCLRQEPAHWETYEWRQSLYEFGLMPVQIACTLLDSLNDIESERSLGGAHWEDRISIFERFVATQPIWEVRDLVVSGQLIAELGASGPQIGSILKRLVEAVLKGEVENSTPELLALAKLYVKEFRGT